MYRRWPHISPTLGRQLPFTISWLILLMWCIVIRRLKVLFFICLFECKTLENLIPNHSYCSYWSLIDSVYYLKVIRWNLGEIDMMTDIIVHTCFLLRDVWSLTEWALVIPARSLIGHCPISNHGVFYLYICRDQTIVTADEIWLLSLVLLQWVQVTHSPCQRYHGSQSNNCTIYCTHCLLYSTNT